MGRHSVMLSPDSVSRVTPPTTMTTITSTDESMSQFPTAGGESTGSSAAGNGVVPLDEKKRGSSAVVVEGVLGQCLESLANEYGRAAVRNDGVEVAGGKQKRKPCSPRLPEDLKPSGLFGRRRNERESRPAPSVIRTSKLRSSGPTDSHC